jgi:hypothetical protein
MTTDCCVAIKIMNRNKIVSPREVAIVQENAATGGRSLHAAKAFKKEEIICPFKANEEFSSPSRLTLQKGEGMHIALSPSFLQCVNHSCSPNAFFDTTAMQFLALKDIEKGEELTFFYPSTEWEMAQAFLCRCGSEECLHSIQGAAFLPDEVLQRYRLTDFILRKLAEQGEVRA